MGFVPLQGLPFLVVACGLQEASRLPASWPSVLPRFAFVVTIHDGACRAHPFVGFSALVRHRGGLPLLRVAPIPAWRLFSALRGCDPFPIVPTAEAATTNRERLSKSVRVSSLCSAFPMMPASFDSARGRSLSKWAPWGYSTDLLGVCDVKERSEEHSLRDRKSVV